MYLRVGRTYALRSRLRAVLLFGACYAGGTLTGVVALVQLVVAVSARGLSELEALLVSAPAGCCLLCCGCSGAAHGDILSSFRSSRRTKSAVWSMSVSCCRCLLSDRELARRVKCGCWRPSGVTAARGNAGITAAQQVAGTRIHKGS